MSDAHTVTYRYLTPIDQIWIVVAMTVLGALFLAWVWWLRRARDDDQSKRRRFRFSLRTLFVVLMAVGVVAWLAVTARLVHDRDRVLIEHFDRYLHLQMAEPTTNRVIKGDANLSNWFASPLLLRTFAAGARWADPLGRARSCVKNAERRRMSGTSVTDLRLCPAPTTDHQPLQNSRGVAGNLG